MKVAPWDLARQSVLWTRWANMAESAENEAQEALQQQADQRQKGSIG